jgi:hypothetical protein
MIANQQRMAILIENTNSYRTIRIAFFDNNLLIYYWNMAFLLDSESNGFQ